jgi:hypothetical protein
MSESRLIDALARTVALGRRQEFSPREVAADQLLVIIDWLERRRPVWRDDGELHNHPKVADAVIDQVVSGLQYQSNLVDAEP